MKLYDIEVLEGDMVYCGTEIKAKDRDQAIQLLILMSGGQINEDSQILSFEEKTIH
jgi:hypothetical protein